MAYEMVSGWSTYVKLFYQYLMKSNKAFNLTNDGKVLFIYVFPLEALVKSL